MANIKEQIKKTLYQRCKCCLETDEQLSDMWEAYQCNEEVEVYGEMLRECFDFPWTKPERRYEYICERCIERLRSSLSFRRDILAAQEVLDKLIEDHTKEYAIAEMEGNVKSELLEEADEEAMDTEEAGSTSTTKRKWPKKKKKHERVKAYKQYTHNQMECAVKVVITNVMSRSEAAEKFGVPLKTLGFKVRQREMDDNADSEAKKKQLQLFKEIRKILAYTNATPFKTKIGRFFCAYCSTDGPSFQSASDLRAHTRDEHKDIRLRDVEIFMRPHYLNEILKLDIHDLNCTVCEQPINGWTAMFEHLKEHSQELDLAYTRVIPFVLQEEVEYTRHQHVLAAHAEKVKTIACEHCDQTFTWRPYYLKHVAKNHTQLEKKFKCKKCDKQFRQRNELKKHEDWHTGEGFTCMICNKKFSSKSYLQKHTNSVHSGETVVFVMNDAEEETEQ
ncbi:zinc-finger associated domain (zf-AD) domain-containing protein [Phthorimaea operculella]|nr:zinc-finger associated domain (zf-AD) domain-containing protein [Phthorimaea operculella]